MAVEFNSTNVNIPRLKPSIIFDAEGVSLLGKFVDEISAYRTRRTWVNTFSNFFLLEQERDYELAVTYLESDDCFVLNCSFVSACGRYAFWRLINHQAPEAEAQICQIGAGKSARAIIVPARGANQNSQLPWVLSGLGANGKQPHQRRARKDTIIGSIRAQLEKMFR